ncbi:hypothetical protein SDC9_207694 [bioreactor metagenome]|uniref:Uncharacterized protein n=1 Tax=bioreactor metagenome TaxID=1076179 RepID=A0A645J8K9_9ZZZZ
MVFRILLQSHLVYNSGGHREGRNSGRSDHRVDLLFQKEVHQLGKEHPADGVKHKGKEAETHDEKCIKAQKLLRLHFCGDGDAQEQRDKICQHILCGFR